MRKKLLKILPIVGLCGAQLLADSVALEEKIGQMLVIGFHGTKFEKNSPVAQAVEKFHVGGVILFNPRNIHAPQQVEELNRALHTCATTTISQKLPLYIFVDQEGGCIDRLPRYSGFAIPSLAPQALGQFGDVHFTLQYAEKVSGALKNYGFDVNLAPVVDVNVYPVCPVIGGKARSFGQEVPLVVAQSGAFIDGMHRNKILTCLKHFPGHGSARGDSHFGVTDISATWQTKELEPFKILIEGSYDDYVMTAHVVNTRLDDTQIKNKEGQSRTIPATFSKKLLTGTLKQAWKFEGVVISDDMTMGAIADNYDLRTALKMTINAGVDMLIIANHLENNTEKVFTTIKDLVERGEIAKERIDDAYNRIVRLKNKLK